MPPAPPPPSVPPASADDPQPAGGARAHIEALEHEARREDSSEALADLLYDELRSLARRYMRQERREHTLDPTALANEAFVRLSSGATTSWEGRSHFLAVAARTMRSILVDHARRRNAEKRGGSRERIALTTALASAAGRDIDVLELDDAVEALRALDSTKSRIVVMRFFGGMTTEEIGVVLGMAPATVQRHWYSARAWLRARL